MKGKAKVVQITFTKDKMWLYTFLDKIVQQKKRAGFAKTSISNELLRLADNYLMKLDKGRHIDLSVLQDIADDITKR